MSTEAGDRNPRDAARRLRRPPAADGLRIVGLVGRAGSGKSTVARELAAAGAAVIEADAIGHELTDRDPEVRRTLIADYGADVYRADGALDRARVAARVFADRAALARLDALVHPRIVARLRDSVQALRDKGFRGAVVVDAALMLAWGFERECDVVLAVVAPEELLIARLTARRGWTAEQARARLAAQPAPEEFIAAADIVLDNRGSEPELRAAAGAALERILAGRTPGSARP